MPPVSYLDLDLQIERAANGYHAHIIDSPGGQARIDFALPFSPQELSDFLQLIADANTSSGTVATSTMQAARTFGGNLYNAIFTGDMRSCLLVSQSTAEQQGKGLRIRLRLADAAELYNLPWEYFYQSSLNRFLTLSVYTPLVRYMDLPDRIRPVQVTSPLRVLVMTSSPEGYPVLDVDGEFMRLSESLKDGQGLVTLERLQPASLTELARRLRQGEYHILHFTGHGEFDEQEQQGVLLLQTEDGKARAVNAQDFGAILQDHRSLRLTVLNACKGALTGKQDAFAGVAASLVQQGIPAVIAMQFEISDGAGITFSREFYNSLGSGYPVDGALAEARKSIRAEGYGLEWATPVLYMRAPDGRIFDVAQTAQKGAEASDEGQPKNPRAGSMDRETGASFKTVNQSGGVNITGGNVHAGNIIGGNQYNISSGQNPRKEPRREPAEQNRGAGDSRPATNGPFHFISYSSVDGADFAVRLADALQAGPPAFPVWVGQRDLRPGRDWDEQTDEAIRDCNALLFVMTPDSVAADSTCKHEWTRALKYNKPIIPLVAHPRAEIPFRLEGREPIDFTKDWNAGLARLRQALQPSTASTPTQSPQPSQPVPLPQSTPGQPPYDAFISYSPADRAWVTTALVPALEQAGLHLCLDYRDFDIGAPKLVNVEQAVEQSRKTILVLSPNWVESESQDFESLLTQTRDPAGKRRRMLPVMIKPCSLPPRLEMLTSLDLTNSSNFDFQMARLIKALR